MAKTKKIQVVVLGVEVQGDTADEVMQSILVAGVIFTEQSEVGPMVQEMAQRMERLQGVPVPATAAAVLRAGVEMGDVVLVSGTLED